MGEWIELTRRSDHGGGSGVDENERPMPWIQVRVVGPAGEAPYWCIVDTGSDVSYFPIEALKRLGVRFESEHSTPATTHAGGAPYPDPDPPMIDVVYQGREYPVSAYGSPSLEFPTLGLHDFLRNFRLIVEVEPKLTGRFRLEPREE